MARFVATARRRASCRSCRRAPSCTTRSAISITKRNSMSCSAHRMTTGSEFMSQDSNLPGPKAKKSVALSGVVAGNTALCTVGRTGNDLHYRGYDILEIAETCEFEEIAHLLVHGTLPTVAELGAYKTKLKALRGVPASVK